MKADQRKWDGKYSTKGFPDDSRPNSFLRRNIRLIGQGRALDVAAGDGRNAVFLAQNGWTVDAVDISRVGLRKAQQLASRKKVKIQTIQSDLDCYPIEKGKYDLVANFYFLDRRLIPKIKRGLKKGGKIIFETYLVDPAAADSEILKNKEYLLQANELLSFFQDFRILFYREGFFREGGKKRSIASLLAQKN
jgi:SAM-dependent methyltransferase